VTKIDFADVVYFEEMLGPALNMKIVQYLQSPMSGAIKHGCAGSYVQTMSALAVGVEHKADEACVQRVLATGSCNLPAVQVWTAKMG